MSVFGAQEQEASLNPSLQEGIPPTHNPAPPPAPPGVYTRASSPAPVPQGMGKQHWPSVLCGVGVFLVYLGVLVGFGPPIFAYLTLLTAKISGSEVPEGLGVLVLAYNTFAQPLGGLIFLVGGAVWLAGRFMGGGRVFLRDVPRVLGGGATVREAARAAFGVFEVLFLSFLGAFLVSRAVAFAAGWVTGSFEVMMAVRSVLDPLFGGMHYISLPYFLVILGGMIVVRLAMVLHFARQKLFTSGTEAPFRQPQ